MMKSAWDWYDEARATREDTIRVIQAAQREAAEQMLERCAGLATSFASEGLAVRMRALPLPGDELAHASEGT